METVTINADARVIRCPQCGLVLPINQAFVQVTCARCGGIIKVRRQAQPGPMETKGNAS